jgi:hypothetical protein
MQHNQLPVGQLNANLDRDFVMRVGVPHSSGSLAFHAFNQDYKVMVSSSAFWDRRKQRFHMPEYSDLSETDFALDSAGYTAILSWGQKGKQRGIAGVYPWTLSEYVEFATQAGASWWAAADLCCEEKVAHDRAAIEYRIRATATILEGTLQTLYAWQNELARTCNSTVVANMLPPCVPVIQGRTVEDYIMSLQLTLEVWSRYEGWLAPPALVGIGSMCRRELNDPEQGVYAILNGIKDHMPSTSKLHVYGVKGPALSVLSQMDFCASADSMAYEYSNRMTALKAGVSNTMERRRSGMDVWMKAAMARISPEVDRHHSNLLAA